MYPCLTGPCYNISHCAFTIAPPLYAAFGICYGLKPVTVIEAEANTDHWSFLLKSPQYSGFLSNSPSTFPLATGTTYPFLSKLFCAHNMWVFTSFLHTGPLSLQLGSAHRCANLSNRLLHMMCSLLHTVCRSAHRSIHNNNNRDLPN